MTKKVTVYTSDNCAYCGMVKQYLALKGQDYDEVNIEGNPNLQQEIINMTGQSRVPVTVVTDAAGSNDVTVGYNLGKLSSALS